MVYDPQKRREYYLRTRQLKGRPPSSAVANTLSRVGSARIKTKKSVSNRQAEQRAKVVRLTQKLNRLQNALKEASDALRKAREAESDKRQNAKETEKKNSDGKTTAKERQQSKEYRNRHKTEINQKNRQESGSSGKGKSNSVSDMSVEALEGRVKSIKTMIATAKTQIKKANSLSHSSFVDEYYTSNIGRSTGNNQ